MEPFVMDYRNNWNVLYDKGKVVRVQAIEAHRGSRNAHKYKSDF
jgi:hypothetical protein